MRNPILPDLRKLKAQIEGLKKEKVKKLTLASSIKERNKLMMEIQELEVALKTPSKLKSFGKTFLKGFNITRKTLWKGIQSASRNLNKNAPEFKELSRGMTKRPTPVSPLMEMYSPTSQQRVPIKKMKTKQIKKSKKKATKRKPMKKGYLTWDLP